MTSVVVIGSVNLDLSAQVSRLPQPGETVTGATLKRFPGGKGANQALAAQRLGADVSLVACVGDDAVADEALAMLREGGVDLSRLVVHDSAATGVALISVSESGENCIVVAPGANTVLETGSFELPKADALVCQLEIPARTIAAAAKDFEGMFVINLAPARDIDDSILERADVIVVNETEAAWYGERLNICKGMIATTYGAAGADIYKGGGLVAKAEALSVDAIDTTGAGDTFTAALAVGLVDGLSPKNALRFACAAGSLATTRRGAQPSLPTRREVESTQRSTP